MVLVRAKPGITLGLARGLTMQFLIQSHQDRSRPLPCPCPIHVRFPVGAEHCHGQVLAGHLHFTGRSKLPEGGRDPPASPGSASVDCAGAGHPPGMLLLSQAVFSVLQIEKSCLRSLKQSKIHYGFPFLLLSQSPHSRVKLPNIRL